MSMTAASAYWLETIGDCEINRSISLPFDRHRISDENRSGRGKSISFEFGNDLSENIIKYASFSSTTVEYVLLTTFYIFLFKLTNNECDLCIGMNTQGRYKNELNLIIGMFVNAIPLRCQLNPYWSFSQLFEFIQIMFKKSLNYSYFPLQRILSQHPLSSKATFLDTSFQFHSISIKDINTIIKLGNVLMHSVTHSIKIDKDEIVSKFDFSLNIEHNQITNQLSCTIDASLDLFEPITIEKIAQRFLFLLKQIFDSTIDWTNKPIYELSLILPEEKQIVQLINNKQLSFSSIECLHHQFIYQAQQQSQKIALELDEQCLTYSELLYNTQKVAQYLITEQNIKPGQIICQCVERSLSMVN